ncbi:putative equisetin synthetase [Coniochaeta ligniaria NRRL 30616]|uniref:Putative equisetin synthetase n=1 Tax=Coniochaeta ligniaria NRRL 30616 TaxID=1408157 RepID=A0A1J7IG54_9PEZI|nr:putative equisetin synthetase [Coniochaeta ligniaria NRRL 30616]
MSPSQDLIAVVGTGCRFPGGTDNTAKLWELLRQPRDLLKKIPAGRRWNAEAFFHEDAEHHGTSNVQQSYFLDDDPADFDNNFFNVQPAEAEAIDPQQRMLMEVVYESLVDGGHSIEALRGSDTAVIVGAMADDWSGALYRDWETLPQYAATGMGRSIMSNRISYFFDWHGASITLDTACSSSLVAVHLGIQAIRNGESRVAVAAGTNLILSPSMYLAESNLHMVSTSGRCKMWNKDVDGYGRGEGVAAIVMKPLNAALENGDHIQCIIRGTGLNQDGKTPGMTMPNPLAQAALIRETYARAGLNLNRPEDRPQFFHAHGTGTPAGDPREAEAISRAFYSNGADDKLYVGSIKSIFGHTEGTAGLASLVGSMVALQNGVVPPNMHFSLFDINPRVAEFYSHLEVPITATPWPRLAPGQPRRVSVNSFGFGGANAHAILESYEPTLIEADPSTGMSFTPITVSAASESSLRELLSAYRSYLEAHPDVLLADFAYTLQERRSTLSYRVAFPASSAQDVENKIKAMLEPSADVPELRERHFNIASPRIIGVFTGQGAQWPRMGAHLIESSALAAQQLEQLDEYLAELSAEHRPDWKLREQLCADVKMSKVYQASLSQPLCTAVQILLVNLLKLAGVTFHAVVGHSSGEIAAAYAAGVLTARQAIIAAYYRGFFAKLAASPNGGKGAMVAIATSLEDATNLCELEEFKGRLEIAAQNSLSSLTLTGDEDAVDQAIEILKDEGKFARKLRVDTAYHSRHMIPCAAPYRAAVNAYLADVPAVEATGDRPLWYSSVHKGKVMKAGEANAQYLVDNLLSPVWLAPAIEHLVRENGSFDLALEVGPHPALKGPFLDTLKNASDGSVISYSGLLARNGNDIAQFAAALGRTWATLGPGSVSFEAFERAVSGRSRRFLADMPNYAWDHSRKFWQLSRLSGFHMHLKDPPHPLLGRRCIDRETSDKVQWRNLLRPKEIPWLKGHQLQNQIVFPASGYIVMAIEAILAVTGNSALSLIHIHDFTIERGIPFVDENFVVESLFILDDVDRTPGDGAGDGGSISCKFSLYCGNPYDGSRPMTLHSGGKVSAKLGQPQADSLPYTPVSAEEQYDMVPININRFYNQFESVQYRYTEPFNGINSIQRKSGFATGTVEDLTDATWADRLLIHPAMLDSAFQSGFAAWCCPGDGRLWTIHAPTRIGSVTVNPYYASRDPAGKKGTTFSWETTLQYGEGRTAQDTTILSPDKAHVFIQIQGLDASPVSQPTADDDLPLFSHFEYAVDRPDGDVAATNDAPLSVTEDALEAERLALFYLARLTRTITPKERDNTLPHYKHLLRWADHVVDLVRKGSHQVLQPECIHDTEERFESYLAEYGGRVDVQLMKSVGENLPSVVRSGSSILEYMTKDGMLDRIYAEGLGLEQPNRYMARMIAQVGHRYPRMNVFEIGAGTGGSTRYILPMLGDSFSTYTYTDVSSGFFEAAKERFSEYENRMVYKTYNMEGSPAAQGFAEGAYDVVLASHALHVTDRLDEMMQGIRWLLKPGGYVVIQELIKNDVLRVNLPMCALPGWWVGAESGRPWGPALSPQQWDALLRRCGFSGIDTTSPPGTVFVSQAVDDRVKLLREPIQFMAALPPAPTQYLIVAGGKTADVQKLASETVSLVDKRYKDVVRVEAFEDLSKHAGIIPQSTIVIASELDEPLMQRTTPEKHEALKLLWREASLVVWISERARDDKPHAFMTVGLGRCVQYEYPNITLERIDVDTVDAQTPQILASELLRLESLTTWGKQVDQQPLLWSAEPELYIEEGRRIIPRLCSSKDANDRYNSSRRDITKPVNPQESTILVHSKHGGNHASPYRLECASPLRLETPIDASMAAGKTRTLRVSHFLLQTLDVAGAPINRLVLCVGVDQATGQRVVALSPTAATRVCVPSDWTAPLEESVDAAAAIAYLAAQIIAANMLRLVPVGGTLIVHEPDERLAVALQAKAEGRAVHVVFTTSINTRTAEKGWHYVHGDQPRRHVLRALPAAPSVFFDLVPISMPVSSKTGSRIAEFLTSSCSCFGIDDILGAETRFQAGSSTGMVSEAFQRAYTALVNDFINHPDKHGHLGAISTIPLRHISQRPPLAEHLVVVDAASDDPVTASIQPIDEGIIIRPDKTYCLFGIANEVGRSLCRWMVQHGARHVVMSSRRPKDHTIFKREMQTLGVTVAVLTCDVTDRQSLHTCVDEVCRTMPPIAGLIHGAMVLRDTLFDRMSFEDLNAVLDPKVKGAQLLDELFFDTPLDFFVVMSSLTAAVGNSGQTNYTCANMYMTALMAQRKKRGLAGSTMSMTSLIGLGFVERSDELDEDYFTKLGYKNMSETDLHWQFAEAVVIGRPSSDVGIYAEIASGLVPIYADDTRVKGRWRQDIRLNHLVLERVGNQGSADNTKERSIRAKLADAKSGKEVAATIKESLVVRLKRIMMIDATQEVSEKAPLVEQGIDSLMAVEIRTWFLKELEVDVPVLKILSGGSVLDLVTFGCEHLPKHIVELGVSEGSADDAKAGAAAAAPISIAARPGSTAASTPSVNGPPVEKANGFESTSETPARELQSRMSFGQERFWFLNSYLEDPKTFNMATMFKLAGRLDIERLEKAVQTVVQRHEALRTRFLWSQGTDGDTVAMQGVWVPNHDSETPPVALVSKQIKSEAEATEELERLYQHHWDLDSWEAVKIVVLSLSEEVHYLLCGAHHISLDGFSFSLLFVELEGAYSGRALNPIDATCQPRAFAAEQRSRHGQGAMNKALEYYRGIISTNAKPLDLLPFAKCRTRPVLDCYGSFEARATLEPALVSQLKQMARKSHSTSFHLYLTALQGLLFRLLPDMDELYIGIADANRMDQKYMFSLGLFLNLLPIRFGRDSVKISEAFKGTRDKVYGALQHSDIPFDVLLNELQVPRSNRHSPIFQVFVDYRQVHQDRALWGGCGLKDEKWCNARTGYDIALEITENPSGESLLLMRLQDGMYSQEGTSLLLNSFVNVLQVIATAAADMTVEQLPQWHPKDIERALQVGRGPDLKPQWPSTVSHRVDDMIRAHGDKPALKDGHGNSWTYAEMGTRIDIIAAALRSAGAGHDRMVGVFQDPTADWICSLLAILRIGAIYIPLDLRNSVARLASIVKAAEPAVIVTDASTTSKMGLIGADQVSQVNVSSLPKPAGGKPAPASSPNLARPDSPAVVLFTSGSTGKPKGVIMNHSNLAAECEAYSRFCNLPSMNAVVMQQSTFSFDFSIEQTFVALADGGCLYVVPADKRGDPHEIASLMAAEGITYTSGTPSEYEMLLRYAPATLARCTSWRGAFGGGEYLSPCLVRLFANLPLPKLRLFNNYGPAEVTTAALKGEIAYRDAAKIQEHTMAGYILPGYRLYFVSKQGDLVPMSVPGEIVVGGPGVTAGYLHREDLTRQQYIVNRFEERGNDDRLYRTGDLGHLSESGAVYWDGRIQGDTQVKIRGFRVELTEVEAVLVRHSAGAIAHAVATLRGEGEERFIAAHVLFADDFPPDQRPYVIESLKTTLPLPQYMRPSVVVALAEKPLTIHSKLDRRAIQAMPLPGARDDDGNDEFALLSKPQQAVARLWKQIVPRDFANGSQLTPETTFFNVGGNSLLLVRLQALIKESFGSAPRLVDLMNAASLADMTAVAHPSALQSSPPAIDWEAETSVPLALRQLAAVSRPRPTSSANMPADSRLAVVLAGATGYLGRRVLADLIKSPRIREVICLARDDSHLGNIAGQLAAAGAGAIITLRMVNLSAPNLGLSESTFADLANKADVVINCAANRAFWDHYETLKSVNVDAVKDLLRLAAARSAAAAGGQTTPSFHHISSGAVLEYGAGSDDTPATDGADGYVASKWAAERFLQKAGQHLNGAVNIVVHRPLPVPFAIDSASNCNTDVENNTTAGTDAMTVEVGCTLVSLSRALGIRPEFGAVGGGYLDLKPVGEVVEDIVAGVLMSNDARGIGEQDTASAAVQVLPQRASIRAKLEDLAQILERGMAGEGEMDKLRPVNALEWFSEIKKAGFNYFITSQRLVMYNEGVEVVSRR